MSASSNQPAVAEKPVSPSARSPPAALRQTGSSSKQWNVQVNVVPQNSMKDFKGAQSPMSKGSQSPMSRGGQSPMVRGAQSPMYRRPGSKDGSTPRMSPRSRWASRKSSMVASRRNSLMVSRPITSGTTSTGLESEIEKLEHGDEIVIQMAMTSLRSAARRGSQGHLSAEATEQVLEVMFQQAKSPDMIFRAQAVEALADSGMAARQDVVEVLEECTHDLDPKVVALALAALRAACLDANETALDAVNAFVMHPNPFIREEAEESIVLAVPHMPLEFRELLLDSDNDTIRSVATASLNDLVMEEDPEVMEYMERQLHDLAFPTRMAVVEMLGASAQQRGGKETLLMLAKALGDGDVDVRWHALGKLNFEGGRRNATVFKAAVQLLSDEVDGVRAAAIDWIANTTSETMLLADESGFEMMLRMAENAAPGKSKMGAAAVLSRIVGSGHPKIKLVMPLMQHKHPMTRVAGIWAMEEAVKNLVSGVLWNSQQEQPTIPRCLNDPDRRVRLAAIEVLGGAPPGTPEAMNPLVYCLQDDVLEVRNLAADMMAKLITRQDIQAQYSLARLVDVHNKKQGQLGTGCDIGSRYKSLEVGYTGKMKRLDFDVRNAAIRALRQLGVPLDIILRGGTAIERAVERHSLGFKYELPPSYFEAGNK